MTIQAWLCLHDSVADPIEYQVRLICASRKRWREDRRGPGMGQDDTPCAV